MTKSKTVVVEAIELAMSINYVLKLVGDFIFEFKIFCEMEYLNNTFIVPEIPKIVILYA